MVDQLDIEIDALRIQQLKHQLAEIKHQEKLRKRIQAEQDFIAGKKTPVYDDPIGYPAVSVSDMR
jgi:hypothetical protein